MLLVGGPDDHFLGVDILHIDAHLLHHLLHLARVESAAASSKHRPTCAFRPKALPFAVHRNGQFPPQLLVVLADGVPDFHGHPRLERTHSVTRKFRSSDR